jgi:hypothetical protein
MNENLSSTPLSPNRPSVIDESFDGEAVLVNLDSGCYFALSPAATQLWQLLLDGRSAASLAASVDTEASAIAEFVAELLGEQLLVEAGIDVGPTTPSVELGGKIELQRFTDMQDLLELDPVHDIDLDADGWPIAPSTKLA